MEISEPDPETESLEQENAELRMELQEILSSMRACVHCSFPPWCHMQENQSFSNSGSQFLFTAQQCIKTEP